MITIEPVSPEIAEELCRKITADLPEYFGLSECNEHYALGVRSRENFAAKSGEEYVALISLEFPYPKSSHIYWMGILRKFQEKGVGRRLLERVSTYAHERGASTMTVDTLAPDESDQNYFKTYKFYAAQGFAPLFNLKPQNYEWTMVYMAKNLSQIPPHRSQVHATIRSFKESDILTIVRRFEAVNWPKPIAIFENYLKEQHLDKRHIWVAYIEEHFAGYITLKWESTYEPFHQVKIPEIMDFNVLHDFRNQGIGSQLMDKAERIASKKSETVGIGVGLYEGYGAAQKLYIKRGYIPNGQTITYNYKPLEYGSSALLDDDLVLWFTKVLKGS